MEEDPTVDPAALRRLSSIFSHLLNENEEISAQECSHLNGLELPHPKDAIFADLQLLNDLICDAIKAFGDPASQEKDRKYIGEKVAISICVAFCRYLQIIAPYKH